MGASLSMISQSARLSSGVPVDCHVSLSGSGLRGCVSTNASKLSFTSGHQAVLCTPFGCG